MSIDSVEQAIQQEAQSGITDATRIARVRRGVYSMRNKPGHFMIRLRVPAGIITPEQLEVIAAIAEEVGWPLGVHLTTRQGLEIPGVPADQVTAVLRRLEGAGITTFLTGGNAVRAAVSCPLGGVTADEVFDVTPYALAVDRYFQQNEAFQLMPRKIKLAFEGCASVDHVRTLTTDIGVRAVRQAGRDGFKIVVGGGLGAAPKVAQTLEEFIPTEALPLVIESILSVFNQYGNRQTRARARLKWLLEEKGLDWFRAEVAAARAKIEAAKNRLKLELSDLVEISVPVGQFQSHEDPASEFFPIWKESNVHAQKQAGLVTVSVRCPGGDLDPSQVRQMVSIVRRFAGSVRISIEQNFILRHVPEIALPELYAALEEAGLAACCAEELVDITRCAGADVCLSALTNSRAAAAAIEESLKTNITRDPILRNLRIRVSGCPNSCSHHHAADIGLFGMSKNVNGRSVPHYALLLGGSRHGGTVASRVIEVPALRVGQMVKAALLFYRSDRQGEETFGDFVQRVGVPAWREKLSPLAVVPPPEAAPACYRDLGSEGDFKVGARRGECST